MRYALDLSYLGTNYHGWQIQPNSKSVQETLQNALSTVLRTTIEVVASGRTDTGVHASQQVVHFDYENELTVQLLNKVNKLLPFDVSINRFAEVDSEFHARFDASMRSYIYKIHQRKNPYVNGQSYYFRPQVDLEKLNKACSYLVGRQDFESFSKVRTEVNNFNCDMSEAYFIQKEDGLEFHVTANRFLRGMVRALVGTLLEVGIGKKEPEWIKDILVSKDRCEAGRNVAPEGLFLCKVEYTKAFNWVEVN